MLSASTITFKSPLAKKKGGQGDQISFRSVLRIRPLVGSEIEEPDNDILTVEPGSKEVPQQPKTPFNSPFPKSLPNSATKASVAKSSAATQEDGVDHDVVLRRPSSLSSTSTNTSTSTPRKNYTQKINKGNHAERFRFDYVLGTESTQHMLYESVGSGIVSDSISPLFDMESNNGKIVLTHVLFSLGVSNSGKSYTLFGKHQQSGTNDQHAESEGLVSLMIEHLFSFFSSEEDEGSDARFGVMLSMMELHKEQVHDMLEPNGSHSSNLRSASPLRIHQHCESEAFFVPGLASRSCSSLRVAQITFLDALRTAQVRATSVNETSSRSHVIISIQPYLGVGAEQRIKGGQIMIFDLAGVERTKKTAVVGASFKESISINTSIKGVMSCLRALKWNQDHADKGKLVPYRESKLTMLLQPVFSGKSGAAVVTMIVSAYPGASDYAEKRYLLKEVGTLRSLTIAEGVADKLKGWIANSPIRSPMLRLPTASSSKKRKEYQRTIEELMTENESLWIENDELKKKSDELKSANASLRQLLKEAHRDKAECQYKGDLFFPETDEAKEARLRQQSLVPSPLRNHILGVQSNNNAWSCVPTIKTSKPPFQLTVPFKWESNEVVIEKQSVKESHIESTEVEFKENLEVGVKRNEACISLRERKKARKMN